MLIKYHGKICNIVDTLEQGEVELDIFDNDVNNDDTMKISSESLEDTKYINLEKINDKSEENTNHLLQ